MLLVAKQAVAHLWPRCLLRLQAMLGIFFSAKSAVLIEDVPFTEEDIRNESVLPARLLLLLLPVCLSYARLFSPRSLVSNLERRNV